MANYKLSILIDAQDKATKEIEKLKGELSSVQKEVSGLGTSTKGMFDGLMSGRAIGGAVLVGLGKTVLDTAGHFEKFKSVLTNALGGVDEATRAMKMLKQSAVEMPYSLDEITGSFVKMVSRGFEPTKGQMVQLGDLSASLGKSMDQLVEAMLDAQTGEFERLKEFGVQAQSQGNKVAFTFKGVTTTVLKTDDAIRGYLLGLGNLKGVQGSMITQSDTYEGKVSNLGDARTNLSATIGDVFLPTAKESIGITTQLLNTLNDNIKVVTDWGDSTSQNVLLVHDAFEAMKDASKGLPSMGEMFSMAMEQINNSIIRSIPGMQLAIDKLKELVNWGKIQADTASRAQANAAKQGALLGIDIAMGEMPKKNTTGSRPMGNTGGGSAKKVDEAKLKQIAQEKELIKVTTERLNQVNQLGVSEVTKAKLIIDINKTAQNELKKIRGSDQDDQMRYFDETAKSAQESMDKVKDQFKGIYDAVKDAIGKSKDKVDEFTDKIKDGMDKIKDLKQSIMDLGEETQTSLTDRFVDITNQLADMAKETMNFDSIQKYTEYQQKQLDLQNELNVIKNNVSSDVLKSATDFDKLSPTEKILAKQAEKKAYLEIELKAEEDKVTALENQRKDELAKQATFNTAKAKLEHAYTKTFKDELQDRADAYAGFISQLESISASNKSGVSGAINTSLGGGTLIPKQSTSDGTGRVIQVTVNVSGNNINNGMDLNEFGDFIDKRVVGAVSNLSSGIT